MISWNNNFEYNFVDEIMFLSWKLTKEKGGNHTDIEYQLDWIHMSLVPGNPFLFCSLPSNDTIWMAKIKFNYFSNKLLLKINHLMYNYKWLPIDISGIRVVRWQNEGENVEITENKCVSAEPKHFWH